MAESENKIRIGKVKGEFNVSLVRIWDYLEEKGLKTDRNPNGKISDEQYSLLVKEFAQDREEKEESKLVGLNTRNKKESVEINTELGTKAQQRAEERDQEEVLIKELLANFQERGIKANLFSVTGLDMLGNGRLEVNVNVRSANMMS